MARSSMNSAVLLLVSALCVAAQQQYVRPANNDCVLSLSTASGVGATGYFPSQYLLQGDEKVVAKDYVQVAVAKDYNVQYYPQYKVVNNSLVSEQYVLYQCSQTAPTSALAALPKAKSFNIPLTSVAVPDTTSFSFLEQLGLIDRVQSVSPFVVSPCGQRLLACNRTAVSSFSNQTLLRRSVDPFVDGILTTAKNNDSKAIAFSAALDPGALQRLEWVKFLGLFFNKEDAANAYFQRVQAAYNDLAANVSSAAAAADIPAPVVAWTTHYVFGADESYQVSFAQYKQDYTDDAGGLMQNMTAIMQQFPGTKPASFSKVILEWRWDNKTGGFPSKAAALASFQKYLQTVDVLVDETYAVDPTAYDLAQFLQEYSISNATAAGLRFLQDDALFREDGLVSEQLGSDWFEGALAKPDAVLQDFVRAISPALGLSDGSYTWIRNLAMAEEVVVVGPDACTTLDTCDIIPTPVCPFVQSCPNGGTSVRLDNDCNYAPCPASAAPAAAPNAAAR